jgi:polysaccharide export outer membrane protein
MMPTMAFQYADLPGKRPVADGSLGPWRSLRARTRALGSASIVFAALLAVMAPAAAAWSAPAQAASAPEAPGYTIGPADVLQIIVWKEAELTRDVTVRFDGMITVPLLGELKAAGETPVQLAAAVAKGFEKYVQGPRVTVGILQANSARFYVIGQVGRSGEFPLSGRTTVLQALALAGGFKDFAKTDAIVIVRRDQTILPVNYKRITDGKDLSQNVVLGPGDTVIVP